MANEFPKDTATVFDLHGFPHVGHLTDQRDEDNGTALYYFPGDFIAGDSTEAWINLITAGDAELLAYCLSDDDGNEWTADRPEAEIHVFELTAAEVAAQDEDAVWEYLKRPEFRLAHMSSRVQDEMLEAMVSELGIKGGWHYRIGDDGILDGPFESRREAQNAAERE